MEKKIFEKENFIISAVGLLVLIIGFILLSGGGSEDPNVFNPEIFNFRRLFIAPFIIILGFVIQVVAIMYPFKNNNTSN